MKKINIQLFSLFNPTKGCELEPLFGEIAKNIITIIITTKASLINIVIIIAMMFRWMWGCWGSKWATQVLPAWHGTASNLSLIQIWIKILKRKKTRAVVFRFESMSYTYHRFLLISFPSVATILEIFHLLLAGCPCDLRHYPYVCRLSLLHKGVGWLMTTHCDFDFQFRLMNYWRRRLLTLDGLWHFRAYSDLEFYHCFDLLEVRTWIALAPGGWHLGLGCEAVRPSKIFTFSKLGMGFFCSSSALTIPLTVVNVIYN